MESSESRAPSAGPGHLLVWEADFKMAAHRHRVDWFDSQAGGMLLWLSLAPAPSQALPVLAASLASRGSSGVLSGSRSIIAPRWMGQRPVCRLCVVPFPVE